MVTSIASGVLINSGHLLENLVFSALRRTFSQIFYYKTQSNREVDFLIIGDHGERRIIQACETLVDQKTRKRELDASLEAMKELGLKNGTIVTRNEEESINLDGKTVQVLPAWKFCLTL
jgi:predicted AAA+ superfamily ATPase